VTTGHRPRSCSSHRSCQAVASSSVNTAGQSLNYRARIACSATRSSATLIYVLQRHRPVRPPATYATGDMGGSVERSTPSAPQTVVSDKLRLMCIRTNNNRNKQRRFVSLDTDKPTRIVYSPIIYRNVLSVKHT